MSADAREGFLIDHYAELVDALQAIGFEDADWHDGRGLADVLYCNGWRKTPSTRADQNPPSEESRDG